MTKNTQYWRSPSNKLIDLTLWLFALCVLAILMTSCSGFDPYASLQAPTATATASPSIFQAGILTPIPHYWQLAALAPWQPIVSISNSKASH